MNSKTLEICHIAGAHQADFLIRTVVISLIKYLTSTIQGIRGGRDYVQPF